MIEDCEYLDKESYGKPICVFSALQNCGDCPEEPECPCKDYKKKFGVK